MKIISNPTPLIQLWETREIDFVDQLEFTSFINIRPSQGNRSMEVQDHGIKETIRLVVGKLLI